MPRTFPQPPRIVTTMTIALLAMIAPRPLHAGDALSLTTAGRQLAAALDRLDVRGHWLRSQTPVAWKTGQPLPAAQASQVPPLRPDHTHCSAFAAAAAESVGVYLLRPPEHSSVLLANAQYDWLAGDAGRAAGWQAVESSLDAQRLANQGELVVAAFKNGNPACSGHIAVIRPAVVDLGRLEQVGPQVTQAGYKNYRSVALAKGFICHPGAWRAGDRGAVKFYAHAVPRLAAPGSAGGSVTMPIGRRPA